MEAFRFKLLLTPPSSRDGLWNLQIESVSILRLFLLLPLIIKGDHNAWRAPIALQGVFLILALAVFHGIMESPRQESRISDLQ